MAEEERRAWIRFVNAVIAERNDFAAVLQSRDRGGRGERDLGVVRELREAERALRDLGVDLSEVDS